MVIRLLLQVLNQNDLGYNGNEKLNNSRALGNIQRHAIVLVWLYEN